MYVYVQMSEASRWDPFKYQSRGVCYFRYTNIIVCGTFKTRIAVFLESVGAVDLIKAFMNYLMCSTVCGELVVLVGFMDANLGTHVVLSHMFSKRAINS